MDAIEIGLSGRIWWRLHQSMTLSPPLPAISSFSIASPFAAEPEIALASDWMALSDGTLLFSSSKLLLVPNSNGAAEQQIEALAATVPTFLNALRVCAGQAAFPRSFTHLMKRPINLRLLPCNEITEAAVRRYILESAVTADHLFNASDAVAGKSVPVHRELVLDAAESVIWDNYRSAIIFAAAAVESCAGSVIDRGYEKLLNQPPTPTHRCVSIKVKENETVNKDPVYLALREKGGGQFLALLHEIPLYLFGRSLMLDEPGLYSVAHSLYRTRNSLAHTGTVDIQKSGLLDVNGAGAIAALITSNRVFRWFGEEGISIPDHQMVKCDQLLSI